MGETVGGGWRPSMFDLWQQAGGDGERYRELLHEWGYVLKPGDEGYEDASPALPCGWPQGGREASDG